MEEKMENREVLNFVEDVFQEENTMLGDIEEVYIHTTQGAWIAFYPTSHGMATNVMMTPKCKVMTYEELANNRKELTKDTMSLLKEIVEDYERVQEWYEERE